MEGAVALYRVVMVGKIDTGKGKEKEKYSELRARHLHNAWSRYYPVTHRVEGNREHN